jgi:DNA-binding MarR family transcriptional regulator
MTTGVTHIRGNGMEGSSATHSTVGARAARIRDMHQLLQEMLWTSLRVQSKHLSQYGLTNMQVLAMKAMGVQDSPPDMAFLAEMTALPPSTMTNVIDRLERDGLAERVRHPTDRRKVLVTLTGKGTALLERLNRLAVGFTEELMVDVGDASIEVVIDALNQMNFRLGNFEREGSLLAEVDS